MSSNAPSSRSASSFGSWGGRKRPRDSLEKTRERINSVTVPPSVGARNVEGIALARASNLSVQSQEEEDENQSFLSVPLIIPRHHTISGRSVCERYPRGRPSLLLFILNVIAFYAFGAAIFGLLDIFAVEKISEDIDHVHFQFLKLLVQFGITRIFYPLSGLIADVYIGRWRMIHTGLLLLLIGYTIVVVLFALVGQSSIQTTLWSKCFAGLAILIISAGGGAFEATIIPFGVDQLQGASSAEISSYFYFYYASCNLGVICGIVVSYTVLGITLSQSNGLCLKQLYGVFEPLVITVILGVGLILMICLQHWFFKNTLWENPVKLIAKILCYAARVRRHLPVRNRAFRYGEERKSRIELAKITYDGKFPDEKVEDMKAFCRILFILLTLIPTFFCKSAFDTLLSQETATALEHWHPSRSKLNVYAYPSVYWGINSIAILLFLPVVNFILIPCFPKLSIRARISTGLALYCIGSVAVVIIHAVPLASGKDGTISDAQLGCIFIPTVIFGMAEGMTLVSVLEFIYAQSPESMKGLLTGLYYLFRGLCSVPSSALFFLYKDSIRNKDLSRFYAAFTVVQVAGIVVYSVAATLHKNRLRHEDNTLQERLIIENQLRIAA